MTGKAEYGGLQILVHPMRRDAFERRFPERPAGGYARESEGHVCFSPPSADMGLAPGGRMNQEIFEDPVLCQNSALLK